MPVITEMLGYKVAKHLHSWQVLIPESEGKIIDVSDITLRVTLNEKVRPMEGVQVLSGGLLGEAGLKVEKLSNIPLWGDDQFSDFTEFADEEGAIYQTPRELQEFARTVESIRWKISEDIKIPVGFDFEPQDILVRVSKLDYQYQENLIEFTVELGVYRREVTMIQEQINTEWGTEIEEECTVKELKKKQRETGKLKKLEVESPEDAFPWLDEWLQGKDIFPQTDASIEEPPQERLVNANEAELEAQTTPDVNEEPAEYTASSGILNVNWEQLFSETDVKEEPSSEAVAQENEELYSDEGEWVEPMINQSLEGALESQENLVEARSTEDSIEDVVAEYRTEDSIDGGQEEYISNDSVDDGREEYIREDSVDDEREEYAREDSVDNGRKEYATDQRVHTGVVEQYINESPINYFEEEELTEDIATPELEELSLEDQVNDVEAHEGIISEEEDGISEAEEDIIIDEAVKQPRSANLWQKLNPFKGNEPIAKRKASSSTPTSPVKPVERRPVEPVVLDGLISQRPLRQHINPGVPPKAVGAKKQSTSMLRLYLVKPGDTLATLSKKFSVSIDELMTVNQLEQQVLSVHEMIRIPKNQ